MVMKTADLVGGWTNPFEKYARQNGNLPQTGLKNQKYLSCHHPVIYLQVQSIKSSLKNQHTSKINQKKHNHEAKHS